MATITKRKVNGHVYYYLVEGKRVDGKSRLVKQQYLGRAEQVVARLEGQSAEPTRVRVAEYGGSQALSKRGSTPHAVGDRRSPACESGWTTPWLKPAPTCRTGSRPQ